MSRQTGIALVAAIFLIAVLAALAVFVLRVVSHETQGRALEDLHGRAGLAAQAGVEWGAYHAPWDGCQDGINLALPGTLSIFAVQVRCETVTGGYRLTATARYGSHPAQPDYVERLASLVVTP